jgi:Eukaryotic aspartyl protease
MAPLLTTTTLLSLLFALASAQLRLDVQKNFDAQDKQLKARQIARRGLSERADSVLVGLTNDEVEGLYFANITVGTPGQTLGVQIDTGSSDVWVPSSTASICQDVREGGCLLGSCEFYIPVPRARWDERVGKSTMLILEQSPSLNRALSMM